MKDVIEIMAGVAFEYGAEHQHASMAEMLPAALAAASDAGWGLYPKEATREMREAGYDAVPASDCWRAMLEKAPKP